MDSEGWKALGSMAVILVAGWVAWEKVHRASGGWSQGRVGEFCAEAPKEWASTIGHASNGDIGVIEAGLTTYASVACALAWNNFVREFKVQLPAPQQPVLTTIFVPP